MEKNRINEEREEEKKYFMKVCFMCEKQFKVHYTQEYLEKLLLHYGSPKELPRNNTMCFFCALKVEAYKDKIPCKCKKCGNYFWMNGEHKNSNDAKASILQHKKIWKDFCEACDFTHAKVCKSKMEEEFFIRACKTFEKYNRY